MDPDRTVLPVITLLHHLAPSPCSIALLHVSITLLHVSGCKYQTSTLLVDDDIWIAFTAAW
ncbi:MAG: hypothetical protein CMM01_01115 [Rhodopirellula sp.]|nr:hypothetical protein [Rhodopirellula sp.]